MGHKKARNLLKQMGQRHIVEQGAHDAYAALDDKSVWYAKAFKAHEQESIDKVQRMILANEYPTKEYRPRKHMAENKEREIFPLPFEPWSILFHAAKIVLEPVVEKVLIYDTSAGRTGKGQVFGAKRVKQMLRRYPKMTHCAKSDLRKFYPSIPHDVVIEALEWAIDDKDFIDFVKATMLDYKSDIEGLLQEERERKLRYCRWASKEPPRRDFTGCARGVTIGNPCSQLIGNLVLAKKLHEFKEEQKVECLHQHCDDNAMLATSQEEGERLLTLWDAAMNDLGLCVKASSYVAPIRDTTRFIDGRAIDYLGYTFSRSRRASGHVQMKMRKRTKKNFASSVARVKSRKRRRELLAAYWGIAKWGNCRNLWRTITKDRKMSFADKGFKPRNVTKDGKRVFNLPTKHVYDIVNIPIKVLDFEADIKTKQGEGRYVVTIEETQTGEQCKFITNCFEIKDQLNQVREAEKTSRDGGLPIDTVIRRRSLGDGKCSYYFE